MNAERYIRIFAGLMILISLTLSQLHSQWWLLLTAFVGLNIFQFGISQFCPLETVLKKFGVPSCTDMKE